MASTAHKTDAEMVESFDAPDILEQKLDLLAKWVRQSRSFTAFTGAGISTSAGIPDFRGPDGVWTKRAKGETMDKDKYCALEAARPTTGHMALVALHRVGTLRHVISSNTDGLHLRSGLPRAALTELHGNTNLEECVREPIGSCTNPYGGDGCGAEFFRDERTRAPNLSAYEHATGRRCEHCGCPLQDTVINFNENLRRRNVDAARRASAAADVMLTLGSSLRVSTWPAEAVARRARKGAKLIVCNLQWTPFDEAAALKINARSDDVLAGLCRRLGVAIPAAQVHRRVELHVVNEEEAAAVPVGANDKETTVGHGRRLALQVRATSADGAVPYAFLERVQCELVRSEQPAGEVAAASAAAAEAEAARAREVAAAAALLKQQARQRQQAGDKPGALAALREAKALESGHLPLTHTVRCGLGDVGSATAVTVRLHTRSRFGEPPVTIEHPLGCACEQETSSTAYFLSYGERGWTVVAEARPRDEPEPQRAGMKSKAVPDDGWIAKAKSMLIG